MPMKKIFQFGEDVNGYSIPVLNEREVRAGAGMFFLLMFIAINQAGSQFNFTLLKFAVIIFFVDFIIRVLVNPKYAPSLILGRLIVRNQVPEYVGAKQKKFAWIIGLVLAVIMFFHLVIFNAMSPITGIICLICLIFLFFESVFGICIGCKLYSLFYKDKAQYCPGEVCDVKSRQDIQKTNLTQTLILLGFVAFIVATVFLFKEKFSVQPNDIFGITQTEQSK